MKYEEPSSKSRLEIHEIIENGNLKALAELAISLGLNEEDYEYGMSLLLNLSTHEDSYVKGNAILSFGHFGRRFGRLPKEVIQLVKDSLTSQDEYVRKQAVAVEMDLEVFLG